MALRGTAMEIPTNIRFQRVETDAELQTYLDLKAEDRPDRASTLARTKQEDAARPHAIQRFLVIQDGVAVGDFGIMPTYWSGDLTLYQLWPNLPRGLDRPECDAMVEFALQAIRDSGGKKVNAWAPTHYEGFNESLLERGFKFDQANPESILKLDQLDLDAFQPAIASLKASDLRVFSLQDLLEEDPAHGWDRYHELDLRLTRDVPLPYEFTGEPLESFVKQFEVQRASFPTIQIAADGDFLVATSMLFRNEDAPDYYWTGLTGVDRDYRRRGIAKALKAINFQLAKEAGGIQITCDNEENNPMLQLNYELGFRPYWVWNSYSREI